MAIPTFFGPEILVNTTSSGFQGTPSIAGLAGGKFVAVWADASDPNGVTIHSQIYNANGSKLGSETTVNSNELSDSIEPTVTALTDGRYVVAWTHVAANDGGDGSGSSVKARVFNADGTAAGNEFFINDVKLLSQAQVSIAALADGGFAASWSHDFGGGDFDIHGRTFNADGTPRSGEFEVDGSIGLELNSTTTGLAGGGFVTVWTDSGGGGETDGSASHIRAQIFDANGADVGDEFIVNEFGANDQFEPTVTALANGGFAVAWTTTFSETDRDTIIRIFNANGAPVTIDIGISRDVNVQETNVSMTALADGNLFVSWQDSGQTGETDGSLGHIRGKIFSGVNGLPLSNEFIINSTTTNDQLAPSVTLLADGRVVVSWEDESQSANTIGTDVRAQIIDPRTKAVTLLGEAFADDWVGTIFADRMNGLAGNDVINGGAGNDVLDGGTGDDTLDGGVGADVMRGGAGNDFYKFDNAADIADELPAGSSGIDTILANFSFSLSDTAHARGSIENLTLVGNDTVDATGNASANVLTGNVANNVLDGKGGADTMRGGGGNDTYLVDNAGDTVDESLSGSDGTDHVSTTISFSLSDAAHVKGAIEFLDLAGAANINGTGDAAVNGINGNAGANIIDGKAGADEMRGVAGNDTYFVDNAGDVVDESVKGSNGVDLVRSSVNFSLSDISHAKGAIEKLELIGSANVNATGNALANTLTGNTGANVLNGAAGADAMRGGAGRDTYIVDNVGDVADESLAGSSGIDKVQSAIGFSLSDTVHARGSIENLTLTGTANIAGTGNGLANQLTGNSGNNALKGLDGADIMQGGAGNDVLTGGLGVDRMDGGTGNDTFVFTALNESGFTAGSRDLVAGFTAGDKINVAPIDAIAGGINNAFVLDQGGAFLAGEIRQSLSAGNLVLDFNTDGDALPEMSIQLSNRTAFLSATDFVL